MSTKTTWGEARAALKAEMAEELKSLAEAALGPVKEAVAELRAKQTEFMARGMQKMGEPEKPEPAKMGLNAARFIRAIAQSKGDVGRAAHWAKNTMKDERLEKALMTSIQEQGGALVPAGDVQELIELLTPRTVMRSAGALVVPMPDGTLPWPKITAGATAAYIGEGAAQNAQRLTLGMMNLVWKKLRALMPLTQELVRMSSPAADTVVRNDLVRALAQGEDRAFIRADGTAAQPKGLRYWAKTANVIPSAAADDGSVPTIGEVETDLRKMMNALLAADVGMGNPRWLMAPRTALFLEFLRDATGFKAFPEVSGDRLLRYPMLVSNNVPSDLAGAGTETLSELYLFDADDAIIAESSTLEVSISNEASFHDESGNVVSAFDQDLTIVKAIARHDFGMRHDESVSVGTGILYGAK